MEKLKHLKIRQLENENRIDNVILKLERDKLEIEPLINHNAKGKALYVDILDALKEAYELKESIHNDRLKFDQLK